MRTDAWRLRRALGVALSVLLGGAAGVPVGLAVGTGYARGGVVFALCCVWALRLVWSRRGGARRGVAGRRWAPVLVMLLWWGVLYLGGFPPFLDLLSFIPLALGAYAGAWDEALRRFLSRPPPP